MIEDLLHKIRIQAYIIFGFLFVGLCSVAFMHKSSNWEQDAVEANRAISLVGLLGTTIFSVSLPILIRTWYYNRNVMNKGLSQIQFYHLEQLLLSSVLVGSLFALISYYIPIFRYHLYLTILFGIYGIYTIIPMRSTYDKDIKSFGVINDNN